MKLKPILILLALLAGILVLPTAILAQAKKPNILILWGDDIGYWNISAYNQGMMGYKTPNIDRLAKEGALFIDWYGQQSFPAGCANILQSAVKRFPRVLKVASGASVFICDALRHADVLD